MGIKSSKNASIAVQSLLLSSIALCNADEIPHPDPNEEDYPGMVYFGRHEDEIRLGFHADNTVRYIFGTGYDDSHHDVEQEELQHLHVHPSELPDRTHIKTRDQVIQDMKDTNTTAKLKPFGHVDMHPLDGGVTPCRAAVVDPFFLDAYLVTNSEFSKFVAATYYETEAEQFGWSFVLSSFATSSGEELDPAAPDWVAVNGATWRSPEGPGSTYAQRLNHPVVHVSHRDAAEYCHWKQKRLPGEREWEAAARYHQWNATSHHYTNRTLFAWGDDPTDWETANLHANLWGAKPFPNSNDAADGWRGTSPVGIYPPTSGIYDLTGNVWEWMRGGKHKARIVRGGSYVDSLDGSYNLAATLGTRDTAHATTTTGNVGFRCAKSPKRRVEHHWKWHDEEEEGMLAVEDMYGNRRTVKGSWSGDDDDELSEADDDILSDSRYKKKKVVMKRERLSSEL